jgi:phenylacetate-CoA ligase
MLTPFTTFAETQWPAIPAPFGAGVLAMLFQLDQTQWWPADEIARAQQRQLRVLLEHAYATVPFYRQRFDAAAITPGEACTPEGWPRVPLLARRDVQLASAQLHSTAVPKNHGQTSTTSTGGSTGQPVTVLGTELTSFFWRVFTLREHLWHRRDFSQSFAAIRYTGDDVGRPPAGTSVGNWGSVVQNVLPTGPGYLLNVKSTIKEQAAWLREINPGYVLSYPSVLRGIGGVFEERGWRLNRLREVLTFGEVLEPECRAACQRAFGVRVVDMYSSQEVGYIALQCPEQAHYHIQSENVLVEVLDNAGRACGPGQIGKVVITTLHNFAMPLVRYDIEDYAEVGGPCPCGRGLPVLTRILGRQRNLLTMPNGERRWPVFVTEDGTSDLPPFFQFQVVQRTLDELQLNVVRPGGELSTDELAGVERYFHDVLGYPFKLSVNCVSAIPRSASGKFEDFISLVR